MKKATHLRLQAFAAIAVALVAAMTLAQNYDEPRVAGRLGPTAGPNSLGHVEAQRAYLDRIAREDPDAGAGALVSFSRRLSAPETATLIGEMETTVVFVLFPEGQPEAIALEELPIIDTVAARAKELVAGVEAEIAQLETQLQTAAEADRADIEASLQRRREALGKLKLDCACVYAVGVQGTTLGSLAQLQAKPEVTLVDVPNPVTSDLEGYHLTPILPS